MKSKFKKKMYRIAKYIWKRNEEECHRAERFGDTRHRCSCWMCRNERELNGPPISELRHLEDISQD